MFNDCLSFRLVAQTTRTKHYFYDNYGRKNQPELAQRQGGFGELLGDRLPELQQRNARLNQHLQCVQSQRVRGNRGCHAIRSTSAIAKLRDAKKLPFPVMHDGFSEATQAFGDINATPTAFLFDKNGQRLQRTIGILDFAKLRATLDRELG